MDKIVEEERNLTIATGLGIVLIKGTTQLSDKDLLDLFDKDRYFIAVGTKDKMKRIDL